MGHRANFVVIENGAARAYHDQWAGLGAAFGIADGPGPAIQALAEYEPVTALLDWAFAEGGYLLDFDQRLVIVFGEIDDMFDDFDEADDEAEDVVDDEDSAEESASCSEKYAKYFAEISPNWSGWRLRYDDRGVDAFAEHLELRQISSIGVHEPSHPEGSEQLEVQA
jgi:hypothetical protein